MQVDRRLFLRPNYHSERIAFATQLALFTKRQIEKYNKEKPCTSENLTKGWLLTKNEKYH